MKNGTILEYIAGYADSQPDKLAVCELRRSVTYKEYWTNIRKTATALASIGIKKGDHIVIRNLQNIDFLTVFSAIQYIGAVPVPLEKNLGTDRMGEIAGAADAKTIINDECVEHFNFIDIKHLCKTAMELDEYETEFPKAQDRSMLLYTTGTTGVSKGVMIKHINDVAIAENVICGTEMKKDNVEIIPMPLNHSFAVRRYQSNMVNGSTVCLMDGVAFIGVLWKLMDKYRGTALALAPASLNMIFKLSDDRLAAYKDQIDYIQLGSAPLQEHDKQRLIELLPDKRMYNLYGSTEAGCSCILNFNSPDNKNGCVGYPTVNSRVRFIDAAGNITDAATEDNPCQLLWGGDIVMEGYYNAPEMTAETLCDGYVKTNDLAYLDEKGRCILVGRIDDVINFGGNKISPGEVEDCAMDYPHISECAYSSRPDEITGEAPVMLVIPKEGYTREEFEMFLSERLEGYKVPKEIITVTSLPKTFNGKLLRREVKKIIKQIYEGEQI
ncbi:MAG: acyl--CoA ligase [Clostridia bacterium]|nr:acyl--CoA ligase [Clostridia bacterium]